MPFTNRATRAPLTARAPFAARAAAAALAVATLLTLVPPPAPAAALEPPRPLPGYRPEFVTQTDRGPSGNCLWASAVMLLDKWTNGDRTITHQRLRALSGDRRAGSNFRNLRIAYRKLGFRLEFSPDGGERITWPSLLRRLRHGAGAVILGDYSRLPRWYGRWDYGFWRLTKKEKKAKDNHAMYIERYDARRGRVWLMDPLAPVGWRGEWISVRALRGFVWTRGGALAVAVTPNARPAPFAGVRLGEDPALSRTSTTFEATWAVKAPRTWRFPGANLRVDMRPAGDPLLAAVTSPAAVAPAGRGPTDVTKPSIRVDGRRLRVSAPLPSEPGAYVASVRVTDRRFGRMVVEAGDVALFVPGERQATLQLRPIPDVLEAGDPVSLELGVVNTGSASWAEGSAEDRRNGLDTARNTRLVAGWIRLGDDAAEGVGAPREAPARGADAVGAPEPVELDRVPLGPGKRRTVRTDISAPTEPGRWALVIDLVDDVDGSFAALGSAPAVKVLEVVDPERAPAD
jgi:hypothetical protein